MFFNGFDRSAHVGVLWKSQVAMCMREPLTNSWYGASAQKNVFFIVPIAGESECQTSFNEWHLCETELMGFLNTATLILSIHYTKASRKNCSTIFLSCPLIIFFYSCLFLPFSFTPQTLPNYLFPHKDPIKMALTTLVLSRSKDIFWSLITLNHRFFNTVKYFSLHKTLFLWTLKY